MRTDDGHIIYQCLNGDPEAFGILVDKYREGIYAYNYAKLQNWHDAEDVSQEVFVQAYRKLHTLKNWDSFAGWLYRIASNFCKNWQKSKSKRPDLDFIEDQDSSILDEPSIESYHENEMIDSVHEALSSLSETYREVLTLYYFGGMDSNKIAEALGTSPTVIRNRLSRARSHLREEIFTMMNATFSEQKLKAGFTFRIVEAIKRIKIQPISQTKGVPWGVSLVMGVAFIVLSINPHFASLNFLNSHTNLPLPSESRVSEFGNMPVNIVKTSQVPILSAQQGNSGMNSGNPDVQNVLLMAPKGEPNTWTKLADMPNQRGMFSASIVNGKIYIIGGGIDRNHILSTVEEYDPETGIWTKKADMPTPRGALSTSVVNGKIYAIGGAKTLGAPLSVVEEYDPATDTWKKKADMPTARYSLSSSVVNGKIYAIGGNLAPDLVNWVFPRSSTVEEYDPITNTWTKKADMPTARGGLSTCVVNGKIYAIGGTSEKEAGNFTLSTVEEYDPIANKWAKKSDMLIARTALSTCAVNGMIYAIGGGDMQNNTVFPFVDLYDPIADSWTKKADMPTARISLTISVIKGEIYAIGGTSKFLYFLAPDPVPLTTIEAYSTGFTSSSVQSKGKLPTTWGNKKR